MLVNVGPVIVRLTSPSRLVQRLAAVRVRDNLMARYRPGERVLPPARTGGWTHLADGSVNTDPVVGGGVVYAGADDGLYALDAVTGRARWKSWPAAPMLVDGVLFGARSDGVAAIDTATGRMRWNRRFGTRYVGIKDLVIQDGGVYAGVGLTHVVALEAATGEQRWRFRVPGTLGRVAVAAGTVHVSSREGMLYALDARTGALRRRSRVGTGNINPAGYLAATGEAVFVITGAKASALDPATGKARWRARVSAAVRYDPVVIGGTVYLGDLAGRTYALNAASGQERWRLAAEGDSGIWNVTASRGKVYVAGRSLHALDPETGRERWSKPFTATVSVQGTPSSSRTRTVRCTRWTRPPARPAGASRPAAASRPGRSWPAASSTSAAPTATCTRCAPRTDWPTIAILERSIRSEPPRFAGNRSSTKETSAVWP